MSLKDQLEPEAFGALRPGDILTDGRNAEVVASMSAAISLKRIADALEASRMDSQVASRLISEAHARAAAR